MANIVSGFNLVLLFIFSLCYLYQAVYVIFVLVKDIREKRKPLEPEGPLNRYAVLISGRNEELVIGELVKSLKNQEYPEELLDIYVIADNCTDNTAKVAREAGARVFERNDQVKKGKSHALHYAITNIIKELGDENGRTPYTGYFVFDADNVVDSRFVAAMNRGWNRGYKVLTSYRNSKNYESNWVSAGSALWFLREAKFLSNARYLMNSSCAISGTGFMIGADIIEKRNKGWIHHLLTEDIEFSTDCISSGIRIGYVHEAHVYDEQPTTMSDSWKQRLRWAKGFYQVLLRYGKRLSRGIGKQKGGRWACFDMTMTIAPAMLLVLASVSINIVFCLIGVVQLTCMAVDVQGVAASTGGVITGDNPFSDALGLMTGSVFQGDTLNQFNTSHVSTVIGYAEARATIITSVFSFLGSFGSFAGIMFVFGLITTITEWRHIHTTPAKKIKYIFTFPFFMLTYVPIALVAIFKKVEWVPIKHNIVRTAEEVVAGGSGVKPGPPRQ